jgi:hypothetical protein
MRMINLQGILIEQFVKELKRAYQETYSLIEPQYGSILEWAGRLSLEIIANSDSLYHDVEHTMMVTLVGQAILKGKHLSKGGVAPRDWLHFVLALLCHDIGYIRGICSADGNGFYATGENSETVEIPDTGTDASLTPYHVSRSKLFVQERFGGKNLTDVDANLVSEYIEMTRFPIPPDGPHQIFVGYGALVRAADFIGQLGDPDYLRKIPALFYEFEETGENKRIGYTSPGHMRQNFTQFYWKVVRPFIDEALGYLSVTQEGKQWIANLNSHVFEVEHNEYYK